MTGAPVPAGADRVIAVERTDGGIATVRLNVEAPKAGAAIRRRAEVVAAGAPLLPAGTRLSAAGLALLAGQGIEEVAVHRPPRVTVLATGDEVVPAEAAPRPGQLRDSHTDYLLAAGRRLGLEFASLGIAPDEPDRLAERVAAGLESDLLLTCGGVSAGAFDHAEAVFARLGCAPLFDAVAIQPGKPLFAARRGGTLVLGLPGNPTSVIATFALFAAPAIDRLRGGDEAYWSRAIEVELATPLGEGARDRDRFLPAYRDPGGAVAVIPAVGSHDLAAFARAELLVRVRAGAPASPAGARAEALPLP
jgi:molybdopterin molybdotransferase